MNLPSVIYDEIKSSGILLSQADQNGKKLKNGVRNLLSTTLAW
jgi:hypothetical protein